MDRMEIVRKKVKDEADKVARRIREDIPMGYSSPIRWKQSTIFNRFLMQDFKSLGDMGDFCMTYQDHLEEMGDDMGYYILGWILEQISKARREY